MRKDIRFADVSPATQKFLLKDVEKLPPRYREKARKDLISGRDHIVFRPVNSYGRPSVLMPLAASYF